MKRCLVLALVCGCSRQPLSVASSPGDLATAGDLATVDLSTDLAATPDLAPPPDLVTTPDLVSGDLAYLSADGAVDENGCGVLYPTGSSATSYQIDPAHDGVQPLDRIALPLCKRWTAQLNGGALSYPVVAGGRVFVTAAETSGYGTRLYALDEHTGAVLWGPVSLGGTYYWSGLGWDRGRLFAVNGDGLLRAFADDSGKLLWSASNASDGFTASMPVAVGGFVYVSSSTGFTVFDGATGKVAWSASAASGDHLSPAIAGSTLYVSSGCASADAFDLVTHDRRWHATASCTDYGGGGTAVFGGGMFFARAFYSDTEAYDGASGSPVYSFTVNAAPAVSSTKTYVRLNTGDVQALPLGQLTPDWTFAGHGAVTAPILAGTTVVVAANPSDTPGAGALFVLDAATGAVRATIALPGEAYGPDEWNYSTPIAGLAVADGMVFVPTSAGLVAY